MAKVKCRHCLNCDLVYDVMVFDDGTTATIDIEDELAERCPRCGSTSYEPSITVPMPTGVNGYPYFDRGLGCEVTSPKHRRETAASMGLAPVDGTIDWDGHARRQIEARDKVKKADREYRDRLEHDPAFADYRRARDKGVFPRGT